MASNKGVSGGNFSVNNPSGKSSVKIQSNVSNPLPGRRHHDCLTGNSKPSQASQKSYAGKSAPTSSGFANSRGREFDPFIGSVNVSKLRHTKKHDTRNQIKP